MGMALRGAVKVTLISAVASLLVTMVVLPAMGAQLTEIAFVMCVAAPLLIALPISYRSFRQKEQILAAHDELAEAHRELAVAHAALAETARRDSLTGLFNRGAFLQRLEATCRAAQTPPAVLLMIDADNFKAINDRFGHLVGDKALVSMADAMRSVLGDRATIGRIGGEEFAVILHGTSGSHAIDITERLRKRIASISLPAGGDRTVALSISIGAAKITPASSATTVMRIADEKLYDAKNGGRNRAAFQGIGIIEAVA